jgi:hypothetical protein
MKDLLQGHIFEAAASAAAVPQMQNQLNATYPCHSE